jgi:hypothetical protein
LSDSVLVMSCSVSARSTSCRSEPGELALSAASRRAKASEFSRTASGRLPSRSASVALRTREMMAVTAGSSSRRPPLLFMRFPPPPLPPPPLLLLLPDEEVDDDRRSKDVGKEEEEEEEEEEEFPMAPLLA